MASSSKQSDPRDMLIPLPKFSPGPQPSIIGWTYQVQAILGLSNETEQVKCASLLNAIPAELLSEVFGLQLENQLHSCYYVLRELREYFKIPNTEIEYYNSLQAPTKSVPF